MRDSHDAVGRILSHVVFSILGEAVAHIIEK